MNNTRYPDVLLDLVPETADRILHGMSISYLAEAPMGECLTVLSAREPLPDEDAFCFKALRKSDGRLCCEARMVFGGVQSAD